MRDNWRKRKEKKGSSTITERRESSFGNGSCITPRLRTAAGTSLSDNRGRALLHPSFFCLLCLSFFFLLHLHFHPVFLCPLIDLWFFPSEPPLVPGTSLKKKKNGRLVISDPQLTESRPPRQSAQSSSGFVCFVSDRVSISGNVVPFIASKEKHFCLFFVLFFYELGSGVISLCSWFLQRRMFSFGLEIEVSDSITSPIWSLVFKHLLKC